MNLSAHASRLGCIESLGSRRPIRHLREAPDEEAGIEQVPRGVPAGTLQAPWAAQPG